jgi:hypothetical protein
MRLELLLEDLASAVSTRRTHNSVGPGEKVPLVEAICHAVCRGEVEHLFERRSGLRVDGLLGPGFGIEQATYWCRANVVCLEVWSGSGRRAEEEHGVEVDVGEAFGVGGEAVDKALEVRGPLAGLLVEIVVADVYGYGRVETCAVSPASAGRCRKRDRVGYTPRT